MNRANQIALFQATNQGLLGIRQSELNYYINLNIAFGTQAALIGGFTYGVFTQNQYNEDYYYTKTFQQIYWVTSACTIAMSVHVIITTMLLQVLGPGLALHGPVGSVANACEGMRREQKTIITAFIAMMVLFAISTVMSFWAVMTKESAIGGTVVFVIASRYWYYYSERIYLRFYWDPKQEAYGDQQRGESFDPNDATSPLSADPSQQQPNNPLHERHGRGGDEEVGDKSASTVFDDDKTRSISTASASNAPRGLGRFLPHMPGFKKRPTKAEAKAEELLQAAGEQRAQAATRAVAMEGYLTKKNTDKTATKEPGARLYVTLNHAGSMFFYKDRQTCRRDPKDVLYKRPLVLTDYWIDANCYDQDRTVSTGSVSEWSAATHGMAPLRLPKFQVTLVPKDSDGEAARYPWVLRCDTEEELDIWATTMREISPASFRE